MYSFCSTGKSSSLLSPNDDKRAVVATGLRALGPAMAKMEALLDFTKGILLHTYADGLGSFFRVNISPAELSFMFLMFHRVARFNCAHISQLNIH